MKNYKRHILVDESVWKSLKEKAYREDSTITDEANNILKKELNFLESESND